MKGIGMKKITGYSAALAMLAAATLTGCPTTELHSQVLTDSNALDGTQLYFIPRDVEAKRVGDAFYERAVNTGIATLPNNPAGDEELTFTNGVAVVALSEPVLYFGKFYTHLYVGVNGAVGLGNSATVPTGSGNANATEHFTNPQISLLPLAEGAITANSSVTFGETGDFVVITYQNVTVGTATDNAFQVEFFKTRGIDGDIALSYPVVSAAGTTGLMGLSNGQLSEEGVDDAAFLSGFGNGTNLTQPFNTEAAAAT